MKECIKCNISKPLECFSLEKGKRRGACKDCRKEYRKTISETIKKNARERNKNNPEIAKAYKKKYRSKPGIYEKERAYEKVYRKENKEKIAASKAEYNRKNADEIKEYNQKRYLEKKAYYAAMNKKWMEENCAYRKEYACEYRKLNRKRLSTIERARHSTKLKSMPKWADVEEINKIYHLASSMGNVHVDHIVPLNSKIVCGLHVHFNLQILDAVENMSKGNRYWPDMP